MITVNLKLVATWIKTSVVANLVSISEIISAVSKCNKDKIKHLLWAKPKRKNSFHITHNCFTLTFKYISENILKWWRMNILCHCFFSILNTNLLIKLIKFVSGQTSIVTLFFSVHILISGYTQLYVFLLDTSPCHFLNRQHSWRSHRRAFLEPLLLLTLSLERSGGRAFKVVMVILVQ